MAEPRPADAEGPAENSAENSVENPFAPPRAPIVREKRGRLPLAPRMVRLAAVVVDGLTWIPLGLFYVWADEAQQHSSARIAWNVAAAVCAVALLAWNALWLHRFGQSIGKRVLRIAIVRSDGSRASLGRIAALRIAPPFALRWIAEHDAQDDLAWFAVLALVAWALWLADVLFILGPRSRCLHDWLAGTIVVETRELPRRRRPR